jgi:Domain of unknown function (DUF4266)
MNSWRTAVGLVLLAACTLLPACASVAPWERGNLAKPQMAFDLNPAQSELRAHAYSSREAGASTSGAAGGGCGCY